MSRYSTTIFIAPPAVAAVTGRYVCLIREGDEGSGQYYADTSLVDLAARLGGKVTDWYLIEDALQKTGVWEV